MRFKEFSREWKKFKLNNITKKVERRNSDNRTNIPLTISAQYGLIDQRHFFNKQVASKDMSNYYLLLNGEFAYNKSYSNGYPVGAIKRLNNYKYGAVSTLYICFSVVDKNTSSDYLSQYFETNKWYSQILEIANEGARNHGLLNVPTNDFFNIKFYKPNLKEQQKIAYFLELIDKRIETQMKIIEEIKSLILSIKNKIIENLIFVKWIKIKDICTITTGKLDANAMKENGKYKFFTCSKDDYYINEYAFDGEALIISGNGELGLIKYYNGKFNAYQRTYVLQNFKLSPIYIKFMMEYYLPRKIYKEKNVGAMPYIVLSTIAELEIPVADNRIIEKMEQLYLLLNKRQNIDIIQLNHLKKQKQFLLNNMFI